MTADIVRWRGGPGSGKTYQLLDYVKDEHDRGRALSDIAIMTFSRSQATDLKHRIGTTITGKERKDLEARTIHGTALSACIRAGLIDLRQSKIIAYGESRHIQHYKAFCEENGLPFRTDIGSTDLEESAISAKDLPAGNAFFAIATYLKSTLQDSGLWETAITNLGLTFPGYLYDVPSLIAGWEKYKTEQHLIEHEDYIRLALGGELPPPAPVLIVDEYQDVSPAQDALIRYWITHPDTERAYLAGDEDQAIYSFRGCNPELLLAYDAKDHGSGSGGERPVSRRCPRRVMAAAEAVLGHLSNALPCDREGFTATVAPRSGEDLARQVEEGVIRAGRTEHQGADIFLLCRYGYAVQDLSRALLAAGLPHTSIRDGRITRWGAVRLGRDRKRLERSTVDMWDLTCGIRRAIEGGDIAPLTISEGVALASALSPAEIREKTVSALKEKYRKTKQITIADLAPFTTTTTGRRIVDILNLQLEARSAIAACLHREEKRGFIIRPDQVRIDTIHAAKGLEAPVVLIHTGYLKSRIMSLFDTDRTAEERRVYFVGITRASDALLFLDGFKGNGVTAPMLQGVL